MILTPDQIEALTGKKRKHAQVEALRFMHIPFRLRPDGTPVVIEGDIYATTKEGPAPAKLHVLPARELLVRQTGKVDKPRTPSSNGTR